MLTIRPKPRASMPSTACRHMLNTPSRLMFSTASQSGRSILRNVESRVIPAALTRMSKVRCCASILRTSSPQASKSPTLAFSKWMSRPSTSRRNSATRSAREPRSAAITVRPARARDLQISEPRPPMPPVTTATRLLMGCTVVGSGGSALCTAACGDFRQPSLRRQRCKGFCFATRDRVSEGIPASAGARLGRVLRRRSRRAADAADQVLLEFLPQLQVALGQLVEHGPRRLADQPAHLLAELLLLFEEHLHRAFQVAAHETLQRVAIEADDLAQQLRREHRLAVLLVLGDDLQQHLPGQVVAGLGVADLELHAFHDQLAHILDRDVTRD